MTVGDPTERLDRQQTFLAIVSVQGDVSQKLAAAEAVARDWLKRPRNELARTPSRIVGVERASSAVGLSQMRSSIPAGHDGGARVEKLGRHRSPITILPRAAHDLLPTDPPLRIIG
jgi:hypothetical protein